MSAIVLAACLAAGAIFVASAASGRTQPNTVGGIWSSTSAARSVSTTVYVGALNCGQIRKSHYEGQRSGAELFGKRFFRSALTHPFDFAGYVSYCHGRRPYYRPEFLISNPGQNILRFRPGGFQIAPGDPLQVTLTSNGAHLTLTITDINTHQGAKATGPSLGPSYGWAAGVLPLFGSALGRPYLRGTIPLENEYAQGAGPNAISGPTRFAPIVFRHFRINGSQIGSPNRSITPSTWSGTTGTGVRVTKLRNGAFIASIKLKAPHVGSTEDVTPVTGTTKIKLPGRHHFVTLKTGEQIPTNSLIDTSHGQVQLTLGLPHGLSETGIFYDGEFSLKQNTRNGDTSATLLGGNTQTICPLTPGGKGSSAVGVASAARAKGKPKGKKIRSLWANAHGNFTTKGSGGAAAVLGTKWFTEDTCYGTYFKAVRDSIKVTVYYPHRHTVVVPQGHSFFAPNEQPLIRIAPLSASNGRYNTQLGGYYKLIIVSAIRPEYVDASVAPAIPSGGNVPLFPDGTENGTARWRIVFNVQQILYHYQNWNVGVRIGSRLYVLKLRVK